MGNRPRHSDRQPLETEVRLGPWRVRTAEGRLMQGERETRLRPRAMEVLTVLLEDAGRVVPKEEILARVWRDAAIEDGALAHCISEIRTALEDDPREPRYIETLPKRGYRLLARVQREEAPPADPRRRDRRRRWAVAAVVVLVALSGLWVLWTGTDPGTKPSTEPIRDRPRVAVLGFTNLAGDPETQWIATALTEMVTTELAVSRTFLTVPSESVARMRQELSIAPAGRPEGPDLDRLRRSLGADFIVGGSYLTQVEDGTGTLRLDLRLIRLGSDEVVAAVVETGALTDLAEIALLTGLRLRRSLGDPQGLATQRAEWAEVRLPSSPKAARLYYEGLGHLRRLEGKAAVVSLQRAAVLEPETPQIQLSLSEAWGLLGWNDRAAAAAELALGSTAPLPPAFRLWMEARCHALAARWLRAIERLRALRLLDPNNVEYALELARIESLTGNPANALAGLQDLRRRSGHVQDPRLWLAEAEIARTRGDLSRQLEAAARAVDIGRDQGAPGVLARALLLVSEAQHHRGHLIAARTAGEEARTLLEEHGGRRLVADALIHRLDIVAAESSGLGMTFAEALDLYRERNDRLGTGRALVRFARTVGGDDPERAEALLLEAVALADTLGNARLRAEALNRLAAAAHLNGDFPLAIERFESALANARAAGDLVLQAGILGNLAGELSASNLERARSLAIEGVFLARRIGSGFLLSHALIKASVVEESLGAPEAARASLEEAIVVARSVEDQRLETIARSLLNSL